MIFNKKDNAMKNIYFSFIVVPIIIMLFNIMEIFISSFNDGDKIIMTYLIIGFFAFCFQTYLIHKQNIKHPRMHYLFILLAINVSLFFGYIIHLSIDNILNSKDHWYIKWIISPLIALAIISIVKNIIWLIIKFRYRKIGEKDAYVLKLEKENLHLKNKVQKFEEEKNSMNNEK